MLYKKIIVATLLLGLALNVFAAEQYQIATFAGGCFWCMEPPYEHLNGVIKVVPGYAGGKEANPSYKDVSSGQTGHVEAVQITYNPEKVTYDELLAVYWRQIDPTDDGGQFHDRGHHYKTAIFFHNSEQKQLAEKSKMALENSGRFNDPIVTDILAYSGFFEAEKYHDDFYKKNPQRYNSYKKASGREKFIETHWGTVPNILETSAKFQKPSDAELKQKLTPLQYRVTQKDETERPFQNEYWNNKQDGIYVDVVSGEPLFSSHDKFTSGTGWPSFTKPLSANNIVEVTDRKLFSVRTEVRSKHGDSHLGHLFDDGPAPTGLRYCINSASLRFVPKDNLQQEGYEKFLKLFKE